MAITIDQQKRSLLSSQARVQVPWVKVTIGNFTFGVYTAATRGLSKDSKDFYTKYNVQYPNYIQSLTVSKINGQINQYALQITYPVTQFDDPNFFEKVFSSVSSTRKIIFTYGDATQPTYVYKEEEAIIVDITSSFNLESSTIGYTIKAISAAAIKTSSCGNYLNSGLKKPSDEIKNLFRNRSTGLQDIFTGMSLKNLDQLIEGGDQAVPLDSKLNISILDYLTYLVSCMVPAGTPSGNISKDIYILTLHDDSTYDQLYNDYIPMNGPYFRVTKTSYLKSYADAYEVDIGYNNSTIVTQFNLENNANYSLLYDYQGKLDPGSYVRRLGSNGLWEDVYAPTISSKNNEFKTKPEDVTWWTKITKYPINASITVQGLLRPAQLMTYLRLNVIFPGGHKHISSGLYIITKQQDTIDYNGYRTQLGLTKIQGE